MTPEEWAQIRINLSGEGTLLLCDLTLDCGLRYEEVTALGPVDVIDGDAKRQSRLGPAGGDLGRSRIHRLDRAVAIGPTPRLRVAVNEASKRAQRDFRSLVGRTMIVRAGSLVARTAGCQT